MSKADEMFEELGFKKEESRGIIFYYQLNYGDEKCGIEFWKYHKEIYPVCKGDEDEPISITMQILQAINEKCKELGWL